MKNFIEKHCCLCCISLLIISLLGAFIFNPVIGRFCVSILLITLITWLKVKDTYFFKLSGTLKTLINGLPLIFIVILGNAANIIGNNNVHWDLNPSASEICLFLISMLGVGLFEESLMRGSLFNIMKESWQQKESGLLKAAIISSLLFGLPHILNYLENPNILFLTLSQIIYACFIGIYFCGLYVKNKNFIGLVLIHALVDLLGEGGELFSSALKQMMVQDTSISSALIQIIICLPLLYLGIKYIRQETQSCKSNENITQ